MLSSLLGELGLFQGDDLNENAESVHLLDIHDTVMTRIGGSWDNPAPMRYFLANPDAVDMTVRSLHGDLLSSRCRPFLGNGRFLALRSITRLAGPWGWKDPRMIYTAPLWLPMFPGGKFVHIVRNGVDVASSLRKRAIERIERRKTQFPAKLTTMRPKSRLERAGFKGSATTLTLEGSFWVWSDYARQAEEFLASVDNERMFFRYEDFLADPVPHLEKLVKFCDLTATDDQIRTAASKVRPERQNAFLRDPELRAFFETVKPDPWMQKYGYSAIAT